MTKSMQHHPGRQRQALAAATICLTMIVAGSAYAQASDPLPGFGNIPFGTNADDALKRNNGNGALTKNADKSAMLSYRTLVAGLDFQVVQNFDTNGRATDANLAYSSLESPNDCIARFNFVLGLLSNRYGKPTSIPAMQHEERGPTSLDRYPYEYGMGEHSGIKAQLEVSYPTPPRNPDKAPANPAKAAPTGCQITLSYLPPGWVAHL